MAERSSDSIMAFAEIQHLSNDRAQATRHAGAIGDVFGTALGIPPDSRTESKTWTAVPEPWEFRSSDGTLLHTISNIRVTAVRAKDSATGIYRCQLFISELWTAGWGKTHYYKDNPPIHFTFSYENSVGGRLRYWDIGGVHTECWMRGQPMNFSEEFNPDIYDGFDGWTRYASGATYYKC